MPTLGLETMKPSKGFFARNDDAVVGFIQHNVSFENTASVLGVSMGCTPRKPTVEEVKRQSKAYTVARRIAVLPASKKFRNSVAVSILAPQISWGVLFHGRAPSKNVMLLPATGAVPFRDTTTLVVTTPGISPVFSLLDTVLTSVLCPA